jgi:ribonuclease P/MRP protein subunit RPP40
MAKFDSRQYGALKGRSALHALIDVTHLCHQALDNCQSVSCLLVDFRKAFDRVDHTTVLRKMSEWNIDDSVLKWMRSYLSDRCQRVKGSNVVSPWLHPNGGMPQGCYFGPYVFLILINDLIANVPLVKFVDDSTAVEIVNPGACSHMQSVLDQIDHWCDVNFMEINTKKTKQMFFGVARLGIRPRHY